MSKFSRLSTGDEVAEEFASFFIGQTVIVTGANTGLGFETARVLASKNCDVVICSRSIKNGETAVQKIINEFPNAKVSCLQLDLGSLKSVKQFTEEFLNKYQKLNILINNAGIMFCPKSLTSDGIESQFGVNHLGHFYLTTLLLPILENSATESLPSRIINLSSVGQCLFGPPEGIKFDDINADKSYDALERYGQAKLANVLFTKELHTKFRDTKNILSIAVHPGAILETELKRHLGFSVAMKIVWDLFWKRGGLKLAFDQKYKTTKQGCYYYSYYYYDCTYFTTNIK
jgi:NAD(P)-dependent dehydrogenase (short-subunit alcohol dehydrogenase family)